MPQETCIKKISNYLSGSKTLLSATIAFNTSAFAAMRINKAIQKCTALTLEKQTAKSKVHKEISSKRKITALYICPKRHE